MTHCQRLASSSFLKTMSVSTQACGFHSFLQLSIQEVGLFSGAAHTSLSFSCFQQISLNFDWHSVYLDLGWGLVVACLVKMESITYIINGRKSKIN